MLWVICGCFFPVNLFVFVVVLCLSMVSLCLFVIILFLFGCFVSLWGWFAFSFHLFGLFMVDLCLFAVICDYFLSIFSLFKVIWLTSQEKFLQTNTAAPGELWPLVPRDCALKACSPIYPCLGYIILFVVSLCSSLLSSLSAYPNWSL